MHLFTKLMNKLFKINIYKKRCSYAHISGIHYTNFHQND